jgi:predicted dinucleotide-binding enzyme
VLGYRVSIANSRGPASLATRAAEIGATAATVKQAARARDILILAVPEKSVWQLPGDIFATTTAIIVHAGNYYPCRDSRIPEIERGLPESAWVARLLGRPVIKAFNNILADSFATRGAPPGTPGRICLSVAGDDVSAKAKVLRLIKAALAIADEVARAYFAADVNDRPPRNRTN